MNKIELTDLAHSSCQQEIEALKLELMTGLIHQEKLAKIVQELSDQVNKKKENEVDLNQKRVHLQNFLFIFKLN